MSYKKSQQKNVFLVGPMGAGKTSIGRALARELYLNFYDSDQVIEERAGASLLWIHDLEGEAGFMQREIKVIAELTALQGIILATGGGTVASPENRVALAKSGVVVYLKTNLNEQLRRVRYCKKRPLAPVLEERREKLMNLSATYGPLYEELADIIYDTYNKSTRFIISELKELILKKLQM